MPSCVLTAVSVGLNVVGPKILGHATNIIVEGVVGKMLAAPPPNGPGLPAGAGTDQAVQALNAAGQSKMADLISTMTIKVGQSIDFHALGSGAAWVSSRCTRVPRCSGTCRAG